MAFPGWSPRETARRARRNPDVLRNMARSRHEIDRALADWLESIAEQWSRLPPPAQALARAMRCADTIFDTSRVEAKDWRPLLKDLSDFHLKLGCPEPP